MFYSFFAAIMAAMSALKFRVLKLTRHNLLSRAQLRALTQLMRQKCIRRPIASLRDKLYIYLLKEYNIFCHVIITLFCVWCDVRVQIVCSVSNAHSAVVYVSRFRSVAKCMEQKRLNLNHTTRANLYRHKTLHLLPFNMHDVVDDVAHYLGSVVSP